MAVVEVIRVRFEGEGDVERGSKRIRGLGNEADRSQKKVNRLTSGFKRLRNAAFAIVGVFYAVSRAFRGLNSAIEKAGIQQIAENKLTQAIRNSGFAVDEWKPKLQAAAAETQRLTNFGDEMVITAQAMLLSFAEVAGPEGAILLTKRLADMSAGTANANGQATDLVQLATQVGKSLSASASVLKRYGISMDAVQEAQFNAATGMDKVRFLAEILDQNFGGLAEAMADPFVQLQNAAGDAQETIGNQLRPQLAGLANQVRDFLEDESTRKALVGLGNLMVNLLSSMFKFFHGMQMMMFGTKSAVQQVMALVVKAQQTILGLRLAVANLPGAAQLGMALTPEASRNIANRLIELEQLATAIRTTSVNNARLATEAAAAMRRPIDFAGADFLGSGGRVKPPELTPGGDGDMTPEKAIELFRTLAEESIRGALGTERHREALGTLLRLQKELTELKKIEAALGDETEVSILGQKVAIADLIKQQQAKIEGAKDEVAQLDKLAALSSKAAEGLTKIQARGLDFATGATQMTELQGSLAHYNDELTRLKLALAAGSIEQDEFNDKVKEATSRFRAYLLMFAKQVEAIGGPLGEQMRDLILSTLEGIDDQAEEAGEELEKLGKQLDHVTDSLSAMRSFLGVFGNMTDGLRDMLSGAEQVVGAMRELVEVRRQMAIAQEAGDLDALQSLQLGTIAPYIGIATGVASLVSSFVKSNSEQRREMRRLREALRDNADAVRQAMRAEFEGGVTGSGVTSNAIDQARQLIQDILSGTGDQAENLRALSQLGIGAFEDVEDQLMALLRGLVAERGARFVTYLQTPEGQAYSYRLLFGQEGGYFGDALDFLDQLETGLGTSTGDVSGALDDLSRFLDLMGGSAVDALARFTTFLLSNLDDLSPAMRQFLEDVQGLDLSDAEGRSRLRDMVATIAALIGQGSGFDFGGLTPDEVDELLSTLLGLAEDAERGGGAAGAAASSQDRVTQVQRVITDVQANALIMGIDAVAFWTKDIAHWSRMSYELLALRLAPPVPGAIAAMNQIASGRLGGGVTVNLGDVNLQRPFTGRDDEVDVVTRAIGKKIRSKAHGVRRGR